MSTFLLLLCVPWVSSVRGFFDGACPRKDPPPGAVVLSLGSRLDLSCNGDVKVNGVKVKNDSNFNKRSTLVATPSTPKVASSSVSSTTSDKTSIANTVSEEYHSDTTKTEVNTVSGENKNLSRENMEYTPSPYMDQSTTTSSTPASESDSEDEEMDTEGEYDDEECLKENRVKRGIMLRFQWQWDKKLVRKEDRDWGEITFLQGGAVLSLASVRPADTGKYTCHHNGREIFAVKVIVAEHPETPSLSCYKKSPSSKIRCEWRPQKPIIKRPSCYLLLSTSPFHTNTPKFNQIPCSYSSHCWCALDNNDDKLRVFHTAFLCVTSIVGNTTSSLKNFTPLDILKPDPPSNVSVQLEQGREMRVTWNLPMSWKQQDNYYRIIYELKYRPSVSSNDQVIGIKHRCSHTITDVLPGVEYLIQLRNREEYDGQWSEWTSPVYTRSWTEPQPVEPTETYDSNSLELGSGFPAAYYPDDPTTNPVDYLNSSHESPHVLWIVVVFAILSVILAVYILRHKNQLKSKLHSLGVIPPHRDLSPPPPTVSGPPEGEALIIFVPQLYKDSLQNNIHEEEENEEGQTAVEGVEAMHFNNKSYFFLDQGL